MFIKVHSRFFFFLNEFVNKCKSRKLTIVISPFGFFLGGSVGSLFAHVDGFVSNTSNVFCQKSDLEFP